MHTQPQKRHSATACVLLAGSIIALTGCATAGSPLTNSEAISVTRDRVQVLTAEWAPLDTTVSLGAAHRSILVDRFSNESGIKGVPGCSGNVLTLTIE